MTQQEAIQSFMPLIEAGKVYDKFAKVDARPAKPGEKIITITGDGKETENTAKDGDFVIRAHTEAREQYILGGSKFQSRYKIATATVAKWALSHPNGWITYDATGSCQGVEYTGPDTSFMASWGEDMVLKSGDMIVTALPEKGSVYRIAAKEFGETYAPREGMVENAGGKVEIYRGGKLIGAQG